MNSRTTQLGRAVVRGTVFLFLPLLVLSFMAPTVLAQSGSISAGEETYQLLAPLPGITAETTFTTYLNSTIRITIWVATLLAVVYIVVGGAIYMTTDAASGKTTGREVIMRAIGGLVLALAAFIILNTINPKILNITSISDLSPANPPGLSSCAGEGFCYAARGNEYGPWEEEECEQRRAEDMAGEENENIQFSECFEISRPGQRKYSFFWESSNSYMNFRLFSTAAQCAEAQADGSEVIVGCTRYENPENLSTCLAYDPLGISNYELACYPDNASCLQAQTYIRNDGKTILPENECGLVDTPFPGGGGENNPTAQYCYQYYADQSRTTLTTRCDPAWNGGNMNACVAAYNTVPPSQAYTGFGQDPCFANPDYDEGAMSLAVLQEILDTGILQYETNVREFLNAGNVFINNSRCTRVGDTGCTNVGGINAITTRIISFNNSCDNNYEGQDDACRVFISGGTEWWLHGNGDAQINTNSTCHKPLGETGGNCPPGGNTIDISFSWQDNPNTPEENERTVSEYIESVGESNNDCNSYSFPSWKITDPNKGGPACFYKESDHWHVEFE